MHLILTGATGTVGAAVLKQCLSSPIVTQLSILSRRQFTLPVGDNLDVQKAHVFVHEDYSTYPDALLASLQGAEGCIWAQGISAAQVKKDEYMQITYDYPLAAAKAFTTLSTTGRFNFVYVSGEGADPTEKAYMFFAKIKGRAEKNLLALPSTSAFSALRIYNVRPGYVDSPEYRRSRTMFSTIVDYTVAPVMRKLTPNHVSPTGTLSKVLLDLATGDGNALQGNGIEGDGRTLRSSAIRRLGELYLVMTNGAVEATATDSGRINVRYVSAVTIALSALGFFGNAIIASHVMSLWRTLRWEVAETEWESSYAGIDSIKIVWAFLSIYFSVSAVACVVGCIGAFRRNASYVRLYRDYSVVDLSVSAFATLLFSLASFRPSVRATVCEALSRQPELMRNLAEAGLDLENCEAWFERAVVATVGIMAVILVVRLQFILAVSNFYSRLVRSKSHRLEDGYSTEDDLSPHRIFLLPNRLSSLPKLGKADIVVYAPVPLSSLSPEETQDLDAREAWISRSGYHKRQNSQTHHRRSASDSSCSPSRHHRHRSSTSRIKLPITPGEPLMPNYDTKPEA